MITVDIHEAKVRLSGLVEQAARGETIVIAIAGKPMVKVVALANAQTSTGSRLGFMTGEMDVPDDFDRLGGQGIESLFAAREA